jgi:MFS transporter, FHS family, L-fucose permease
LAIMAIGALVFLPAAWTRQYPLFLLGLFVIGSGLALLQTATNPYVTLVGPLESAASRISVMGICNKLAGVLAPLVLGAIVLADADALELLVPTLEGDALSTVLDELAMRAVPPYALMALVLFILALLVRWSPLPEVDGPSSGNAEVGGHDSVLGHPNLVLGVVALFLYVGAEVIAVDTIGPYANGLGIPLGEAKFYGSYTLLGMVLGYVLGILSIPRYLRQSTALALSAGAGVLLSVGVVLVAPGAQVQLPFIDLEHFRTVPLSVPLSALYLALLGVANALMWPAIWPLAIAGTGRHAHVASAMLIMAISGGAIMPLLYNAFAGGYGEQGGYWILLPCYLFIGWYAIRGHRWMEWRQQGTSLGAVEK